MILEKFNDNDNDTICTSSLLFPLILKSNENCLALHECNLCIKKSSSAYQNAVVFWRLLLQEKKVQKLSFVEFYSNFHLESKEMLRDIFNKISNHDKHLTLRNCLFFLQNLNICDQKKISELLYNSKRRK